MNILQLVDEIWGLSMQFSVLNIIIVTTTVIFMELQQRREVLTPAGPDHEQPLEDILRPRLCLGDLRFQASPGWSSLRGPQS